MVTCGRLIIEKTRKKIQSKETTENVDYKLRIGKSLIRFKDKLEMKTPSKKDYLKNENDLQTHINNENHQKSKDGLKSKHILRYENDLNHTDNFGNEDNLI